MAEKKVSVYFLFDAHVEDDNREIVKTYKADETKAVELPEASANFWIVRGKAVLASERDAEVKAAAVTEPAEAKADDADKTAIKTGADDKSPKPPTGNGGKGK